MEAPHATHNTWRRNESDSKRLCIISTDHWESEMNLHHDTIEIISLDSLILTNLSLHCPCLKELYVFSPVLQTLELSDCPSLDILSMSIDAIKNLHSIEYCSQLRVIRWTIIGYHKNRSRILNDFIQMIKELRVHLPNLGLVDNSDDMV